jgi:hypothetical protein
MSDREYSKGEIGDLVQRAFELCATCAHTAADHTGGLSCETSWHADGELRHCQCGEFWPVTNQREDGLPVVGHELGFGGSVMLPLNRRVTAELWEKLRSGEAAELLVEVEVAGKGFKVARVDGTVAGVVEVRKLKLSRVRVNDWFEESQP